LEKVTISFRAEGREKRESILPPPARKKGKEKKEGGEPRLARRSGRWSYEEGRGNSVFFSRTPEKEKKKRKE